MTSAANSDLMFADWMVVPAAASPSRARRIAATADACCDPEYGPPAVSKTATTLRQDAFSAARSGPSAGPKSRGATPIATAVTAPAAASAQCAAAAPGPPGSAAAASAGRTMRYSRGGGIRRLRQTKLEIVAVAPAKRICDAGVAEHRPPTNTTSTSAAPMPAVRRSRCR
jgi:hypothetical protein